MWKCIFCKTENADDVLFCERCGQRQMSKVAGNTVIIPSYGKEIDDARELDEVVSEVGGLYDGKDDRSASCQSWQDQALAYLNNREYDLAKSAIECALNCISPDEGTDSLYYLAADVYYSNRDYRTASNYINKAIIKNQIPRYYVLKSVIYGGLAFEHDNSGINYLAERYRLLNMAIKLANEKGLKSEAGIAYGVYAVLLYQKHQLSSAEDNARKGIECGDAWGNSASILDKIQNEREAEDKRAAEQKKNQELAEERRREYQRQEELRKKEVEEQLLRSKKLRIYAHLLYWPSLIAYLALSFNYLTVVISSFYNSSFSAIEGSIFSSLIFMCISVVLLILATELMNGFSGYIIVAFGAGVIGLTLLTNGKFSLLLYCLVGYAIAILVGRMIGKMIG